MFHGAEGRIVLDPTLDPGPDPGPDRGRSLGFHRASWAPEKTLVLRVQILRDGPGTKRSRSMNHPLDPVRSGDVPRNVDWG